MSSITQKTRKPLALVATAALALFMSAGFALPANAGEGDEVYTTVVDPIPPTAPTCESDGPIVPEQPEGVIVSYENGGLTVVFTADTGYKFFEETQTVYEFEAPADCDLPVESENPAGSSTLAETGSTDTAPGLLSVAGLLTLLGAAMIRSSRRLIGGIN